MSLSSSFDCCHWDKARQQQWQQETLEEERCHIRINPLTANDNGRLRTKDEHEDEDEDMDSH